LQKGLIHWFTDGWLGVSKIGKLAVFRLGKEGYLLSSFEVKVFDQMNSC
jgi:hypothetical protein